MFILPFNRDISVGKTPWLVVALIIITLAFLPAAYIDPKSTFQIYGFIPAHPRVLTIFTSMFLHAGFLHWAGNMFFLWMFGTRVEDRLGRALFAVVYLACGLAGNMLHLMLNHNSTIPTIGASGAISGIAGAYFVFFPQSRFDLDIYVGWWHVKTIPARTHAAVGAWIVEQFLLGLLSQYARGFGVAFWAHVGGFALGLGVGAIHRSLVPSQIKQARLRDRKRLDGDFGDLDDRIDDDNDPFKGQLTTLHLNDRK